MKNNFSYTTRNRTKTSLLILFLPLLLGSCKKYLDQKPDKRQVVPSTLQDLQALVDNQTYMNASYPAQTERTSDNYFFDDATYNSNASSSLLNDQSDAQHYIWYGQAIPSVDWFTTYQNPIYTSNVILDQLQNIVSEDATIYNSIKGSALFIRAFALYELAQLYCKPYQASTAGTDLGLVLRATSSITDPTSRASVQATYDFILSGLKQAATLLPVSSLFPTRPNKVAAYGELARTYLSMRQYDSAGHYADLALGLYNTLVDYNTRVPVQSPPMTTFNAEVIFHSVPNHSIIGLAQIDTILYQSYNINDLRKQVFFQAFSTTPSGLQTFRFQGSYNGNDSKRDVFEGLTTGELYLIRAESYAKAGNTAAAMADLNTLMQNRWKSSSWTPFTATNATDALQQIRTERRKELVCRGLRWSDLRRYNLEDSSITLKRIIAGTTYTLPPNDKRWVMLIPSDVINRSGIQQNPR